MTRLMRSYVFRCCVAPPCKRYLTKTTPPLDLVATYDETADLEAKTNLLRTFTVQNWLRDP